MCENQRLDSGAYGPTTEFPELGNWVVGPYVQLSADLNTIQLDKSSALLNIALYKVNQQPPNLGIGLWGLMCSCLLI